MIWNQRVSEQQIKHLFRIKPARFLFHFTKYFTCQTIDSMVRWIIALIVAVSTAKGIS